tara:strand:+ start:12392 stop:13381 length:990 start_codon:yes stop_codon:yes gene_type:complete
VIGHRGLSGWYPEHTLGAYRAAMRRGADFIEPDLVMTKDGVLIARHENDITHTTNVAKKFPKRKRTKLIDGVKVTGYFTEDFTFREIRRLYAVQRLPFRNQRLNKRYRVPSLREILKLVQKMSKLTGRPIGVYPETKHPTYFASIKLPMERKLIMELERADFLHKPGRLFVQSFEVGNLKKLHKMVHDLPLIQLLYTPKYQPYDLRLKKSRVTYGDMATPKGLKQIATYAKGIGVPKSMIVPIKGGKRLPPTTLLSNAHRAGLLVHAYTFRNEKRFLGKAWKTPVEEYQYFYRLGIDGVFSDFPDLAYIVRERMWRIGREKGLPLFAPR